jgi:hypothetical protein
MTGRVRSGQKICAKRHFLLMGDLNPGSEVVAGGDIVILGSLRGKAIAGHPDNPGALILALDFRPTQIQIGPYVAAGLPPAKAGLCEFALCKTAPTWWRTPEGQPLRRSPLARDSLAPQGMGLRRLFWTKMR